MSVSGKYLINPFKIREIVIYRIGYMKLTLFGFCSTIYLNKGIVIKPMLPNKAISYFSK